MTGEQVGQLQLKAAFYEHEAEAYERARERCERFLREHPEERGLCASALLRLAYSYEYQGELDKAAAAYQRVIGEYEEFPEQVRAAKADLAFAILAPQGQLAAAMALTRAVLDELEPTDPMGATLRYRLARFHLEGGQPEQALLELEAIPAGERGSDPHLDVRLWRPRTQAACLLRLGRLEAARQVLNEALKDYSSLILQGPLEEVERWANQPLRDLPEKVWVEVPHPGGEVRVDLPVTCYGRIPLEVQTQQPWLHAAVSEKEEIARDEFGGVLRGVILEVKGGLGKGKYQDTLTLWSPLHGEHRVEVPVEVCVPGWIHADPPEVFFGFVPAGETVTTTVTLTSPRAFQVKPVQTPSPAWTVELAGGEEEHRKSLHVRFQAERDRAGHILEGEITLETDVPGEERLTIPCYAHVIEANQ